MVNLPTCTGEGIASNGIIESTDAFPEEIWGGTTFKADQMFNLAYVPGSARLYNNGFGAKGTPLSASILTSTGVLIGYKQLDGVVPAGYQYSCYVTFEVRPQFAP
jgi:hypothetical protein